MLAAADRETREGGIGAFEANELRLLALFGNQVANAFENARLHRDALEKQALERDLELAATIQSNILPKAIPQIDGVIDGSNEAIDGSDEAVHAWKDAVGPLFLTNAAIRVLASSG